MKIQLIKILNHILIVRLYQKEKANSLVDIYPSQTILSADTIVLSPNNKIFEKPKDEEDAYRMLRELSGKSIKY